MFSRKFTLAALLAVVLISAGCSSSSTASATPFHLRPKLIQLMALTLALLMRRDPRFLALSALSQLTNTPLRLAFAALTQHS